MPAPSGSRHPKRGQAKPTQPTNQARQWFSHALLGMMLLRDKRPDAEIAICFPAFKTYENLVARTQFSLGLLGFGVFVSVVVGVVTLPRAEDQVRDLVRRAAIKLRHRSCANVEGERHCRVTES
jgi:hypothetical protein